MKRGWLGFIAVGPRVALGLLVVIFLGLFAAACGPGPEPPVAFETISSDAFTIHYPDYLRETAQGVLLQLEGSLGRITDHLRPEKSGGFVVRIYPDLREFHDAIGRPDAPDWVVGMAWGDGELRIVSPENPGPTHDYAGMLQVAVHELTHCVTKRVLGRRACQAWLGESIALYEAGQFRHPKRFGYMQDGTFPRFLDAASTQIYNFGYTVVEYIVSTWGMETVRQLVLDGGNVGKTLGLSNEQFYEGWYGFVRTKYLD